MLFIADYPTEKNINHGMMIRIKEIDQKFIHEERTYLDICFFHTFTKTEQKVKINSLCTVYHFNFFLDFFKIAAQIKKSDKIYSHTVYNYTKVLLLLAFVYRKKPVAHDLHGAIPEELSYQTGPLYSFFFGIVEYLAFKRVNYFVHVTEAMKKHFQKKYAHIYAKRNIQDVCYGIVTDISGYVDPQKLAETKRKLGVEEGDVVFVYAGGTQKWQKFNFMLDTIKAIKGQITNAKFILLTGELDTMRSIVKEYHLEHDVFIDSVPQSELKYYYELAHYGFVLRDDHILNHVSNPTKLSEYLSFGITPVVLCERIGDYYEMGYEFVNVNNVGSYLFKPTKSEVNKNIYKNYRAQNAQVKIPFE